MLYDILSYSQGYTVAIGKCPVFWHRIAYKLTSYVQSVEFVGLVYFEGNFLSIR